MTVVRGVYFDGRSSAAHPATLRLGGGRITIEGPAGLLRSGIPLTVCSIDPSLGKSRRSVHLPGGAVFEAEDGQALRSLEKALGRNRGLRFVHLLEKSWRTVLLSLCGIGLALWAFHLYAIPVLAKKAAFSLPPGVTEEVSNFTLRVLDKQFFRPSELGRDEGDRIQEQFRSLLKESGPDAFNYRLEFRKSAVIGANAFALPSGLIVMTDELVKLSAEARELDAVLLHEMAHVRERHALRSMIQNAGIFLVIATLTGDLSQISSTAASLPAILASSGYSRTFEREADRSAVAFFRKKGWPVKPMQEILGRMSKDMPALPGEAVFSTHPLMEERLRYIEAMARP